MILAGLMVLVGATALMVRGEDVAGALLGLAGLALLVLGRPMPSVRDIVRKGQKP